MPDRPDADQPGQHASYSPPPLPRADRIAVASGQRVGTAPRTVPPGSTVGAPGWVRRDGTTASDPAPRAARGGGVSRLTLLAAVVAALAASVGTYALLLGGGHLDRQVLVEQPLGQQTRAEGGADPDVIRVVEENAVTDAVDKVSPAVVTITPQGRSGNVVYAEGVGSGVIYDPDGWVVTNRHVVCDADSLSVQLADGQRYEGTIYGLDTLTDLAIVKVEAHDLPTVDMGNSGTLKVGQHAIAIGSPLGTFTNSVTTGVVSAMGRRIDVADVCSSTGQLESLRDLIQTDAAINPGNSGGALVDIDGALIGINTAIAGDAQGIGFAIPINLARPIMQQAVDGELLSRPWMGIWYTSLTPIDRDQRGLLLGYGALVEPPEGLGGSAVFEGSPADVAGIQEGDIITHVDGIKVDGDNPLDEILTQYRPHETVSLRVLRGEQVLDLQMELGTRPANQ
jgi:serine protease Do